MYIKIYINLYLAPPFLKVEELKSNAIYNGMPNNKISVLFRFAYWHHKMEYDFSEETTIRELIEFMQKHAYTDFEFFKLDPKEYPCITIIEMGQYNNVNGYDQELAPAMEPSDETLKERYKGKYQQVGFFIRYSNPIHFYTF